jgi:hypothetical protein
MQPQGAQWKPNPQPSRTGVMLDPFGCGRTDRNGEACALIETDDASTAQVRTNDNLLNIDEPLLLAAFVTIALGDHWKWKAHPTILSQGRAVLPRFICEWLMVSDLRGKPRRLLS